MVVNPDTVKLQIDGGILFGVSATLRSGWRQSEPQRPLGDLTSRAALCHEPVLTTGCFRHHPGGHIKSSAIA